MDEKSWVIILWLTINYFLSLVYMITSTAILCEWCYSNREGENDLIIHLNIDRERGVDLEMDQRNLDYMLLNKKDLEKLRTGFVLSKKDLLKSPLSGVSCSICFDSLDNVKKQVIKLPQCYHLFHWK